MTISCELVRDLLPLYDDNVISEDGYKIVSVHLSRCAACRAYHKQVTEMSLADNELLKKQTPPSGERDFRPLAKRYKRKRYIYWGAAAAISAVYAGTLIYCISKLAENGDKK